MQCESKKSLLMALIDNCRTDLRHIIEKRIGMEHFTDKLCQLPKHESYSHAAKKPQLTCQQPSEVIFDFEFTCLFKRLESKLMLLALFGGVMLTVLLSVFFKLKFLFFNFSIL